MSEYVQISHAAKQLEIGLLQARRRMETIQKNAGDEHSARALLRLEKERLEQIELALDAINTGRYGVCLECGKNIPDERLTANPKALRCVNCIRKGSTPA